MIIALTAIADSNDSHYTWQQQNDRYNNPWAIPQQQEYNRGFEQPLKYQNQQYPDGATNRQNQGRSSQNRIYQEDRFVTPELLESLKQQQSRYQTMPENRYLKSVPGQSMPQQPDSRLYGPFTYPSNGVGNIDPLYDTPVITPWSPWNITPGVW